MTSGGLKQKRNERSEKKKKVKVKVKVKAKMCGVRLFPIAKGTEYPGVTKGHGMYPNEFSRVLGLETYATKGPGRGPGSPPTPAAPPSDRCRQPP